jgi:hypothetical protein
MSECVAERKIERAVGRGMWSEWQKTWASGEVRGDCVTSASGVLHPKAALFAKHSREDDDHDHDDDNDDDDNDDDDALYVIRPPHAP